LTLFQNLKFLKQPRFFLKKPLTILIMIIIIILRGIMIGKGRKHSGKRDAILRVIRSTTEHPGAQWVYEKLKPLIPNLSLGTVYRNLNLFRHEGLVVSVGVVSGEERFDGVVDPHPHLVCGRCGRVIDLPCPAAHLTQVAGCCRPPEENREGGTFSVDYRRTVFYGLCGDCASQETTA
jgi:Fur family peroxide stress response transcriptional regulator